jgi:hypothetical protein
VSHHFQDEDFLVEAVILNSKGAAEQRRRIDARLSELELASVNLARVDLGAEIIRQVSRTDVNRFKRSAPLKKRRALLENVLRVFHFR